MAGDYYNDDDNDDNNIMMMTEMITVITTAMVVIKILIITYRESRSVEDTTLYCLTLIKKRTCARAMFIDFSSAFNTIQPYLMLRKLMDKNVNSKLIIWIHKFLTGRLQYVRFKNSFSNCTTINTGAPQGCVLSASLFTIYESDNGPKK